MEAKENNLFPKLFFEMLTKTAFIQQNILGLIIAHLGWKSFMKFLKALLNALVSLLAQSIGIWWNILVIAKLCAKHLWTKSSFKKVFFAQYLHYFKQVNLVLKSDLHKLEYHRSTCCFCSSHAPKISLAIWILGAFLL